MQSTLPFADILRTLPLFGVEAQIIDPQPGWTQRHPQEDWPRDLLKEIALYMRTKNRD